jgi:hypothetical protein
LRHFADNPTTNLSTLNSFGKTNLTVYDHFNNLFIRYIICIIIWYSLLITVNFSANITSVLYLVKNTSKSTNTNLLMNLATMVQKYFRKGKAEYE